MASKKHKVNEGLPISYIIRSSNRIDSTSTTDTNMYTVFIKKPDGVDTNKFLFTFGGIYMRKLAVALPTGGGSQRHIQILLNLPTYFSFDSSTQGNSNVIGFATYRLDEVGFFSTTPLPYQKLVYFESSGVFEVRIQDELGNLFQDNATNVLPNHVIQFTLTPIYD